MHIPRKKVTENRIGWKEYNLNAQGNEYMNTVNIHLKCNRIFISLYVGETVNLSLNFKLEFWIGQAL